MALSKIDVANMLTGATPVANGGTGATSFTAGITEADQWRITSGFTGVANPIASNWERNDTDFEKIGTGLTNSSGTFSFPNTGKWLLLVQGYGFYNGDSQYNQIMAEVTTNNSSYNVRTLGSMLTQQTNGTNGDWNACCQVIIDVTNTTNVKFRLKVEVANNNSQTVGDSGNMLTGFTCIRLGDT